MHTQSEGGKGGKKRERGKKREWGGDIEGAHQGMSEEENQNALFR
jgi:hypothetical protein